MAAGVPAGLSPDLVIMPDVNPLRSDRRAYVRLNSKINVRYKIFKSQDALAKKGNAVEQFSVTKNISAGGLLFTADEAFPIGTILAMAIELPDGKAPIECLARVVRVEEMLSAENYEISVCFLDMVSTQKSRLDNYVTMESK